MSARKPESLMGWTDHPDGRGLDLEVDPHYDSPQCGLGDLVNTAAAKIGAI